MDSPCPKCFELTDAIEIHMDSVECLKTQLEHARMDVETQRRVINDIMRPMLDDEPDAELSDVQRLTERLKEAHRRNVALGDLLEKIAELVRERDEAAWGIDEHEEKWQAADDFLRGVGRD